MNSVRLPRLLDANLNEVTRLRPSRLQVDVKMTPLSRATMSLPAGEPDVAMRAFVELYDPRGSLGIYQVSQISTDYGSTQAVGLKHGLTLLSNAVTGDEETISGTAQEVLSNLLACQTVKLNGTPFWTIGRVDVPDSVTVSIAGKRANILQSALDILKRPGINGRYMYTFDQSGFPWVLNLIALTDEDASEGRMGRNLASVSMTIDDSDVVTRVYADELDGGFMEIESPFGTVSSSLSIPDGVDAAEYALDYLQNHAEPRCQIELDAIDLKEATGEPFDAFYPGRMCRVPLPDYGITIHNRVTQITYEDLMGDPDAITVTMGNAREDTSYYLANQASEVSKNSSRISGTASGLAQQGLILRATQADLVELDGLVTQRFNDVYLVLDEQNAAIALKASQALANEAMERISQAEIDIDGANAAIALKASQITVDELGERVSAAEISIDGANSKITLKADKVDLDALITEVNGLKTGGVKATSLYTGQLIVTNSYFHLGSYDAEWQSMDPVTSVSGSSTGLIVVRDADGNIAGTALTGYRVTYSTSTINYVGR